MFWKILAITLAVLIFAGAITFLVIEDEVGLDTLFGEGTSSIEDWVGSQLQAIANDHLGPDLAFNDLDYQYPDTVTLRNVKLTENQTSIIDTERMTIVFAERPSVGEPVVISTIELHKPKVRLIETETGGVAGLSNLVETDAGQVRADGGSTRLRDVFDIRRIEITGGVLSYEPIGDDVMQLDDISVVLDAEPVSSGASVYALDLSLQREPLTGTINGTLNLDDLVAELSSLQLNLPLDEQRYTALPPQVQSLLRRHEITGDLRITADGRLPLNDILSGTLNAELQLDNGHATFGEYVFPLRKVTSRIAAADQQLKLQSFIVEVLDGRAEASGTMQLTGDRAIDLVWSSKKLQIKQFFQAAGPDAESKYAGLLSVDGSLSMSAARGVSTLDGQADAELTQGKLVNLPVLSALLQAMKFVTLGQETQQHGQANIEIRSDLLDFTNLKIVGNTFALEGQGQRYYDGRVDFRFHAGPLTKITDTFGALGDLLSTITDRLVKYHVTGTTGDLDIQVQPLGIGFGQ